MTTELEVSSRQTKTTHDNLEIQYNELNTEKDKLAKVIQRLKKQKNKNDSAYLFLK